MAISLVRIDDRLVHGQVVEAWLKPLQIRHVLVISEALARDAMQPALMKAIVPDGVGVAILNVKDSVDWAEKQRLAAEKAMILAPSAHEILSLIEAGIPIPRVNLGGLHAPDYKLQLSPSIHLREADCEALRKMIRRGVKVEAQSIPAEAPKDVVALGLSLS